MNAYTNYSQQVHEIETKRSQQHFTEERRENKALLWELQNKTREYVGGLW